MMNAIISNPYTWESSLSVNQTAHESCFDQYCLTYKLGFHFIIDIFSCVIIVEIGITILVTDGRAIFSGYL